MKLNQQLLQINRNFLICFIISASLSAISAQLLSDLENHLITTFTIIVGYVIFFGIFSVLFFLDNKKRYKQMDSSSIKKELLKLISSFGLGEIVYLFVRWMTLFYFLEMMIEPFASSLVSEIISTSIYMIFMTIFLMISKTY